jgi:MFS family permease
VTETKSSDARPGVVQTLLLLAGVVPFMAGLFGLYSLLNVGLPLFGLLFLVYWAAILEQDFATYLPTVLGGLGGILLGWLLVDLPSRIGQPGTILSVAALAVVLFCFMRGQARLVVNNATMLFLTVATASELKVAGNALVMAQSLLLAAAYMGAIAGIVHLVAKRRAAKSPAAVA